MSSSNRKTNFSSQRTAIPFGKFESGTNDIFPCNESMVGREGARAKLIDFLTNAGTRKAILVTGRRGMGKTSFVNYCLEEYKEARIERYWRSDIGRTLGSWLWLLAISTLCAATFVLGSEVLKILLDIVINKQNHLLWIPFLPLFFCFGYPIKHAVKIFTVLFKIEPKIKPRFLGFFCVLIIVLVFGLLGSYIPNSDSPDVTLSRLLVMIASIYYTGELFSEIPLPKFKSIRLGGIILTIIGVISCFFTFIFEPMIYQNNLFINEPPTFISNLLITSGLLGLSALNRFIGLSHKPIHIEKLQLSTVLNKSKIWYISIFFIFSVIPLFFTIYLYNCEELVGIKLKLNFSSEWFVWPILLFLAFCFTLTKCILLEPEKKNSKAKYRIRYVHSVAPLALKAFFFILLSLYALSPLFTVFETEKFCHWPFCNISNIPKNIEIKTLSQLLYTKDEFIYIALIVAIAILIFWVEYEWLIRPGQLRRRDRSMDSRNRPNYYEDLELEKEGLPEIKKTNDDSERKEARHEAQAYIKRQANIRERRRDFEALTFIGYFKHLHLTTLVSTINLGFEELDHRSVIHAMLLDIREQYYKKFISLRSPRVVVRSIFGLFLAIILVTELSNNLFNVKFKGIEKIGHKNSIYNNEYCPNKVKIQDKSTKTPIKYLPKVPLLLCELGGFYAQKLLPLIYFELLPIHLRQDNLPTSKIVKWSFDIRTPYYLCNPDYQGNCTRDKLMSFCVYHLLLFAFVFYLFRRINRSFEIMPYPVNLEKIDELLYALTSTTKIKSNRNFPMFVRYASAFSGSYQENEKSIEQTKLDPRLVELQFMSVLEKICHSRPAYFTPLQSGEHAPSIEITFVFDELDKLATDINMKQQKGNVDSNDSELHRLNLMKGLLSNMKRIITSSEARYIFLGGRLLHDDWLADGARRQPLLTSIFSDEIYLPSLLTDASIDWFSSEAEAETKARIQTTPISIKSLGTHSLHTRIEEFFVWQYYLARIRFEYWIIRISAPIVGLPEWDDRTRGFIQISYKRLKNLMEEAVEKDKFPSTAKTPLHTLTIRNLSNGKHLNNYINSSFEYNHLSTFIHFLAYRSGGNPKRLNELLASFIMTADRAVDSTVGRDEGFHCQDVLYLPDHKVIRIQLIARVYRQLCKGFEEKIRGRDDKTIVALIYLSDFLFKFHDRAFSWESLELIDELVHMHRGHDLRMLLHELVEHYTDRYLHRIINGMYSYRFRGYFANEIEYLSRNSEEEMAAFNFTLDESQMLRSHLENLLDSGDNRNKTDILSMLGELHEFYQEFEMARQYYRRCVNARLPMIKEHIGDKIGNGTDEMSVIQAIYTNKFQGREALLALQQWGPMTLRWFLQIVMTYERENNFNNALIRYERYITFAECMIQAFALERPKEFDPRSYTLAPSANDHTYVLEYLGLLFEPLFAYAWLLEKNSYTSGNSHFVLDEGIKKYEEILNKDVVKPEFMGFVKAQWYKKIGALCFYKGLVKTEEKESATLMEKPLVTKKEYISYITHALKYYSKSAIQLSLYFRKGVGTEFNKNNANTLNEAFLANQYPTDYCFNIAECLGDLSESILSEIDPIELFKKSNNPTDIDKNKDFEQIAITHVNQLDEYFFDSSRVDNKCVLNWLAELNYCKETNFENLNLIQKYDLSLNLALASSFYMLRAGYIESAAREAMHTAEVIAQYSNWYWFDFVIEEEKRNYDLAFHVISMVMKKIIWYSNYLKKLFRSVRSEINLNSNVTSNTDPYLIGELIPSSALTSLCSIGMSLSFFLQTTSHSDSELESKTRNYIDELCDIIHAWTGNEEPLLNQFQEPYPDKYEYFEEKLIYSIQRHRYPVLNQLNTLKILVDNSLIRGYLSKGKTKTQNTSAWLQELHHINKKYNHPLHFTPMQFGFSLFLYWYIKNPKNKDRKNEVNFNLDEIADFDLHTEFRHSLIQNLDMCHMGRGYYEAINNMYYLYDDFNDNQIHRNHAMQMAGTELTKKALNIEKDKNS